MDVLLLLMRVEAMDRQWWVVESTTKGDLIACTLNQILNSVHFT